MNSNLGYPRFTIKSSLLFCLSILCATLVFPLILDSLGLKLHFLRVLVIGVTTGLTSSYCFYCVNTKQGISKKFWITALLIGIVATVIAYFWVYNIYFI